MARHLNYLSPLDSTGIRWRAEAGGPADAAGDWRTRRIHWQTAPYNVHQHLPMATDNQWWPPAAANELSSGGYISRIPLAHNVFQWKLLDSNHSRAINYGFHIDLG
ncbi:hypothetical protein FB451DRAFT_1192366 [Mycena latifolia]|nr:hypothetical protein FB451DRAFT_1192366 [Mycena latifolia]